MWVLLGAGSYIAQANLGFAYVAEDDFELLIDHGLFCLHFSWAGVAGLRTTPSSWEEGAGGRVRGPARKHF